MKVNIDRFEGQKAVLIFEGQQLIIDRMNLPKEVKEGDFLDVDFKVNKKTTEESRKRVSKLLSKIFGERG